MMDRRLALQFLLTTLAITCGGGSPSTPSPTQETYPVAVTVFYDQNGNGALDGNEAIRIPDCEVQVGGRSGRSEKTTGRAAIAGVPRGSYTITVKPDTLPPFYAPGMPVSVTVPQAADASQPVTLPIGSNVPNLYMGFGDSITNGEGSESGDGYRSQLQAKLQAHFGGAVSIADEGASGSKSDRGASRIDASLSRVRPAFTLILYGTNDWHRSECRNAFPCFTIDSLSTIVRSTRAAQSLPFLATIVPTNPNFNPPERNEWVAAMNNLIRPLARQEGAVLVDLEAAFLKVADQPSLFADSVHPNDRGYAIIADEYFKAISRSSSGSTSARRTRALLDDLGPDAPTGAPSDPGRSPHRERRVPSP